MYEKIIALEKVRSCSKPDWENILDTTSDFKLLYSLCVIAYLLDEGHEKDSQQEELLENEEYYHFKKNWRNDFIICGGYDHLWKIFTIIHAEVVKNMELISSFKKKIYSLLLQIFKKYLIATFSS